MVIFADRVEAGRRMVRELEVVRGDDVVVLGLPRGGVPVASALDARVRQLRRGRQRIDLTGRVEVIVDDGIATGSTARVACQVARRLGARRVIMAAPVAAAETIQHLPEADAVVCVSVLDRFVAVSAHYRNVAPITEDEVVAALDSADPATLLIVGSADDVVLDLNRRAQEHLRCPNSLEIVAGASHLFEEPGTLARAATLARDWFSAYLPAPKPRLSTGAPR